jgi:hypothetical protein
MTTVFEYALFITQLASPMSTKPGKHIHSPIPLI